MSLFFFFFLEQPSGLPTQGQDVGVTINTIRPGQITSMGHMDERCKHYNNLQSALIITTTHRGGGMEVLRGAETQDTFMWGHTHTNPHRNTMIALCLKSHPGVAIYSPLCKSALVPSLDDPADIQCRCALTDKKAIHKCIFIRHTQRHLKIHCKWMDVWVFPYCVDNRRLRKLKIKITVEWKEKMKIFPKD